ncbi:hypothetical protein HG530_011296 [Fusarium avenaceum]|nr:hypothetical protein HG530_011296 [Fusarium avenaceum]
MSPSRLISGGTTRLLGGDCGSDAGFVARRFAGVVAFTFSRSLVVGAGTITAGADGPPRLAGIWARAEFVFEAVVSAVGVAEGPRGLRRRIQLRNRTLVKVELGIPGVGICDFLAEFRDIRLYNNEGFEGSLSQGGCIRVGFFDACN